jgi:restriction endonuclease Mrr
MTHISKIPEFAQLTQEINALAEAKGKVQSRISEIESLLRSDSQDDGASHVAAALEFATTGKVLIPSNTPADLREAHVILRQQRESLDKAIIAKQQALSEVHGTLSRKACEAIEDKHRKLAGRYLATLRQLDAIAIEEIEMVRALEQEGYNVSLRAYVQWPNVGLLSETSGSAIWHKEREMSNYAE